MHLLVQTVGLHVGIRAHFAINKKKFTPAIIVGGLLRHFATEKVFMWMKSPTISFFFFPAAAALGQSGHGGVHTLDLGVHLAPRSDASDGQDPGRRQEKHSG